MLRKHTLLISQSVTSATAVSIATLASQPAVSSTRRNVRQKQTRVALDPITAPSR
jgi:hypothetical protein